MYPARIVILVLAVTFIGPLWAHQPDGEQPESHDVVVARVYTRDQARLDRLIEEHNLLYYIWREGYAVIRTDRGRLPDDAVVDQAASAGMHKALEPFRGTGTIPARPCYRTVEQTYIDLQALAATNPQLAQWVDFGDSWEMTQGAGGYDLRALVISNTTVPGPKPVFMIIAASHARELATAEVATRFAEMLLADYGTDPDVTWMLDRFSIHVIPMHNPDGRKMAEAECTGGCFPAWRKNTNDAYCVGMPPDRGADLNRNADNSFWGGPWSSGNQCSETYRGPAAASEPETSDLEAYLATTFPDFRNAPPDDFVTPADDQADGVFISIHSAGDIVFYPWEGIDTDAPNITGLRALAQKVGFATTFAACQNCFLGPASGTNVDFVYEKLGVPAFTFEIGSSFGQSCSSFDNTVLPQTLDGLLTALRHTRRAYQAPLGPDVHGLAFTPGPDGGTLAATADDTRRAVNGGGEPVDPAQAIAKVRFTVGLPPWLAIESFPMTAADGLFDDPVELATAALTSQQVSGTALVYVYAEDSQGNVGPPSAVWVTIGNLFYNGFESP